MFSKMNKYVFSAKKLFVFFVFLIAVLPANAGWYIVRQNTFGDGTISYTKIKVDKNCYKIQEENMVFLFYLDKELVVISDDNTQKFWEGKVKDVRATLISSIEQIKNEQFGKLPKDQKYTLKPIIRLFDEQIAYLQKDSLVREVVVQESPLNKDTILGEECMAYRVLVDGKVVENNWLNPQYNLNADVDWGKLGTMLDQISTLENGTAYRSSLQYVTLMQQGIVMRSLDGLGTIREVISIQPQLYSESDFRIPEGYKPSPLIELMNSQIKENIRF